MILSVYFQLEIFITTIFLGLLVALLYDFIRLFRTFFKHSRILIDIEDLIFWSSMSIIIFLVSLYKNDGEIRFFFVGGLFIGIAFYFVVLSKIFFKFSNFLILKIKKLIILIVHIILLPVKIALFPVILSTKFLKSILIKTKFYVIICSKLKFLKVILSKVVTNYKKLAGKNQKE